MGLFKEQTFKAASGQWLTWKIECDFLTPEDWSTIAMVAAKRLDFHTVEGVPRGGLAFAEALKPYAQECEAPLLIVDDILTTGGSMERFRAGRNAWGLVLFARGPLPRWIDAIWTMGI